MNNVGLGSALTLPEERGSAKTQPRRKTGTDWSIVVNDHSRRNSRRLPLGWVRKGPSEKQEATSPGTHC